MTAFFHILIILACMGAITKGATWLVDSSVAEGMHYSAFFVAALTDNPGFRFYSNPDSGYSVDNLEPEAPAGLLAQAGPGAVALAWDPNEEEDFDYYAVYRDTV